MLLSGCVNGDREIPRETHRTVMQCAIEHANAAAEYIESLTRERDELRRIFDEAPHMPGCYQSCPPRMCDCWKARVAAANP